MYVQIDGNKRKKKANIKRGGKIQANRIFIYVDIQKIVVVSVGGEKLVPWWFKHRIY